MPNPRSAYMQARRPAESGMCEDKDSRGGQEEQFPPPRLSAGAEDFLAALGPDHLDIRVMAALMPLIFK